MSAIDSVRAWARARGAEPFTPGQCFDALDDVDERQHVYAAINTLYTKEKVLGRRKKGTGNEYVWHEFAGADYEFVPTTEQLVAKGLLPPPAARAGKSKTPEQLPPVTAPAEAKGHALDVLMQPRKQAAIMPVESRNEAGGRKIEVMIGDAVGEIPAFLRKDAPAAEDMATAHPDGVYLNNPPKDPAPRKPSSEGIADAIIDQLRPLLARCLPSPPADFEVSGSTVRITIERMEITLEGVL